MGAIVALGGGFLVFSNKATTEQPVQATPTPPPVTMESFAKLEATTRHFKGAPAARFTVIEFADFQCPSCRNTYDMVLKKFGKEFPQVRFGFRHFPLDNVHPFATPAAVAVEFANKQGKFWEVYEGILAKPKDDLTQEIIDEAVKAAGLDMALYAKAKTDATLLKLATDDRDTGVQLGVSETPTFFLRDNQTKMVKMVTGWKNLYPELTKDIPGLPTPVPAPANGAPPAPTQ